jgi:hypothetical protein
MKRIFIFLIVAFAMLFSSALYAQEMVLLDSIVVDGSQNWWNAKTQLNPLRLPPPQKGDVVSYYDLNGDGKPDMLRTVTVGGAPVQWIDDNGNMKIGDVSGDLVDDCVMIDCDRNGEYGSYTDVVVDWVDTDDDGRADLQTYVNYRRANDPSPKQGHYMLVFDTDKDDVFNYVDWNTFKIRCWLHYGQADFYEDYNGNSTFLKVLASPEQLNDVRLNWENPFWFVDHDKDGLTEMAIRLLDIGGVGAVDGLKGTINYASISIDLDNDNNPENPLDLDMTVLYGSEGSTPYTKYSHIYKKMRGLPESDFLFIDANWRSNTELIFPFEEECFDFIFKDAKWDRAWFVYDEDGDCKRWERVEQYEPGDLYATGEKNGGLDNHRQSDAIGDRGEWDSDNSGGGSLYISPMDGKLHLYGAEWGAWRIDQNAWSWQGMGGIYEPYGKGRSQKTFEGFAVVKYEDTDGNGFLDAMYCDWNGDKEFDECFSLKDYGLSDVAAVLDFSKLRGKDFTKIYAKMAGNMWKQAQAAMKVASKLGLETKWYALYQHPKSLRQKYDFGYWLQLYIYHDIADYARRTGDKALETAAAKAWLSGSWNKM